MKEIKGTYKEVREQLPEELREVLDHVLPPTAHVNMVDMGTITEKDSCSIFGCKSCGDDCPIDKELKKESTGVSISPYVDCIDVELAETVHAIDYLGVVPSDKKAAVLSSLKQIIDAAMHAVEVLE